MGIPDIRHLSRCLPNIGKDILESAALFEVGVAAILAAESELLEELLERKVCTADLLKVNEEITQMICCLKDLEEEIVDKIRKGECLLDKEMDMR